MRRWLGACLLTVLSGPGCSDARLLDGSVEGGQTRLRLSPGEFVGEVPCRRGTEGALQSYVARLQQFSDGQVAVTADAGADAVLTSPPAPCDRAVVFPAVASQLYAAEVLGFDRQVSAEEALTVEPRWRARCGFGKTATDAGVDPFAPTRSIRGATVPLRGCTLFAESRPTQGRSQLAVDVAGALGALRCGRSAGEVGFVEATLGSSRQAALCGEPLIFDVDGPSRYLSISLTGFEFAADGGAPVPSDSGSPVSVPPSAPEAGPAPDADGGADASADGIDAGSTPPSSLDAGQADAGLMTPTLVGVPRWATVCLGQSLPGTVSTAVCDPFTPLP